MTARNYRIHLDGVLGDRFDTWFPGFHLERASTGTVLVGACVDESALFGIIDQVESLGLGLLTVESSPVGDEPLGDDLDVAEGVEQGAANPAVGSGDESGTAT